MKSAAASLVLLSMATAVACTSLYGADDAGPGEGEQGGACYPNATCNAGLACRDGTCVVATTSGSNDAGGPDAIAEASLDANEPPKEAGGDALDTEPVLCDGGGFFVGQYATWYGKVNVHKAADASTWQVDDNCNSGASENTVEYCKKFWPTAVVQIQLATPSNDTKPFTSAGDAGTAPGCGGVYLDPGQNQFECCSSSAN